eukprot:TRINITY_DN19363_c0_g1_i1.p1 TRINITY_DN19363_c0_g1~~TRINITY_DN19363_c0_g1_i1.p1  ORF type:complete len:365 (-),score=86.07 TRINITY_DN19363_c0_g1_i1:98-1192(-)
MAKFEKFQKMLVNLVGTQNSIESTSAWMVYNKKESEKLVKIWKRSLEKSTPSHRLLHLYVCNDVVQNSKRKGKHFSTPFARVLPDCLPLIYNSVEASDQNRVTRTLDVWETRQIFPAEFINSLRHACGLPVVGGLDAAVTALPPGLMPLSSTQAPKSPPPHDDITPDLRPPSPANDIDQEIAAYQRHSNEVDTEADPIPLQIPSSTPTSSSAFLPNVPTELSSSYENLNHTSSNVKASMEEVFPESITDLLEGNTSRAVTLHEIDSSLSILSARLTAILAEAESREKLMEVLAEAMEDAQAGLALVTKQQMTAESIQSRLNEVKAGLLDKQQQRLTRLRALARKQDDSITGNMEKRQRDRRAHV